METTIDLGTLFQQDEFNTETYNTIRGLGFATRESLDRLRALVQESMSKNEGGSASAATRALKIGVCLLALSRRREAREWLEKAPPGGPRSFFLGRAALDDRQYREAAARFAEAAGAGWDALECDCLRAESLLLGGDEAEAEKLLDSRKAEGEDCAQWLYTHGRLAQQRGEVDVALEYYEQATEVDPDHAWALFHYAYLRDLHGSDDRAKTLYQGCAALPFVHADALLNLAVIHEDNGEYEKAARCLRRVLAVDPNHPRAKLYLKDVLAAGDMYIDETQVKEQERQSAVLDIPVADFELSVRSRNCLKKMNIMTLGDLLRTTEAELLAYKNFGETSLKEIKAMLLQKGLVLGQNAPPSSQGREEGSTEADSSANPEVLNRSVATLELSVRARKCLQRLNINTISELVNHPENELLEARNFGQTSLSEIKEHLQELGLNLKGAEQ